MFDISNLIPEAKAREIYANKKLLNSLEPDELRVVFQSLYFYDKDLFAHHVTTRWVQDQASGIEVDTPEFHRTIWRSSSQKKDVLCVVARDHGKTTAESKIDTLHELIYKTEKSILIISAKGLGEKIVGDIKKELETNEKIKWLYGVLVPIDNRKESKSDKWRQRYLQLLNGTELQSLSKGEPIRGFRPTKIKVDDPQGKKDVKNPIMVEEFWHWFFTEVYNTLDDSGSVIVLATFVSANCFAARLKLEAPERGFEVIEFPAILNFAETKIELGEKDGKPWGYFRDGIGTPLWPQKWSIEALEKRFNKIGRKAFLQEYQNIPYIVNGSPVFDQSYSYEILEPCEQFEEYDLFVPLRQLKYGFIGIDLAKGASTGDYSTIIIRDEHYKLLAQYRGHIAQDRLAKKLDQIITHFEDVFIVPENNYGLAFLLACQDYDWYDKLYRQKKFDEIVQKETEILGFNTNAKTKLLIIADLEKKYRSGTFEISAEEKTEIEYYYHDERGGMNAIAPHHDDLVIADALSVQAVQNGLNGPQLIVF